MESSTEEKTLNAISQTDFINFLKEKQIDIEGSSTETMFESFLVFQKFMNVMFRKPALDYQSERKKATEQNSIYRDQANIFPLTEENNFAAESLSQPQMHLQIQKNNDTVEDINYHINDNNKNTHNVTNREEYNNANEKSSNRLTLETQNELKSIDDKDKDNRSYKKQYMSYDDIPIKPSTINFVELVEKNLAELQYQPDPQNEKRVNSHHLNNNNKKQTKNKPRSSTVKEKGKNRESLLKQDSKRETKGEQTSTEKKKTNSVPKKQKQKQSNPNQHIEPNEEIKEEPKIEEEEERPSVLPQLIKDNMSENDDEGNENDEEYLRKINHIEKEKEKIVPIIKRDEVLNAIDKDNINDIKQRNDCYHDQDDNDIEELLPKENHQKKHIDQCINLSQSDSFNIILPEYENYDTYDNVNDKKCNTVSNGRNNTQEINNVKAKINTQTKEKEKEDNQSYSDDIIINCDSDEEENDNEDIDDNNDNDKDKEAISPLKSDDDNTKQLNKEYEREMRKLNEEKKKVQKQKQDYEKMMLELKKDITKFNETKKREYAQIERMKSEEHLKLIKNRPLSLSNATPILKQDFNQTPSNQSKKDKEQIEQLKAQIIKLQEEHKIRENKSKMTIEKFRKQLQEANAKVAEYILIAKGKNSTSNNNSNNNKIKASNKNNNIKAYNYNDYNTNTVDSLEQHKQKPNYQKEKNTSRQTTTKQQKSTNLKAIKHNNSDDESYDLQFPSKYNLTTEDVVLSEDVTSDGKVIKLYSNHMREVIFASGAIKKIYEDGYQIIFFNNNDIKQIYPNGKSAYYFSEAKIIQTILPNNLHIYKLPNGKIEKHYLNKTKEVINQTAIRKALH